MWNVVDSILLNEDIIKNPQRTLTKLQEMVYVQETRTSQYKGSESNQIKKEDSATALFNEKSNKLSTRPPLKNSCLPGWHNKLAQHPIWACFKLSQEKRDEEKKKATAKAKKKLGSSPQDHLATLKSITNSGEKYTALLTNASGNANLKPIVLDSGATHHMCNDKRFFFQFKLHKAKVGTGNDDQSLKAIGIGKVILVTSNRKEIILRDTLYVPGLNQNLISMNKLFSRTVSLTKLNEDKLNILLDRRIKINGSLENQLIELSNCFFKSINNSSSFLTTKNINWHNRLGHQNNSYLNLIVPGYKESNCEICKV
mgnify:CR=1 FL=1